MSLNTRDAQGYPLAGIDVVPHYPQKTTSTNENRQIDDVVAGSQSPRRSTERIRGVLAKMVQDLVPRTRRLKYGDTCRECQTLRDTTPPGDTITLCPDCSGGKVTLQSLQL